jgi:hypothetical protein
VSEPPVQPSAEVPAADPPAEPIPDDAELVRFLAEGEFDTYRGRVIASANALKDPALSVDWLGHTCLADGYGRKPKSKAHAVFVAKAARDIEQSVMHKPKRENVSHSQIECPEALRQGGKRRPALAGLLVAAIASTGMREEHVAPPNSPP